ncbi:hypothetical protein [Bradyrhizobium campsiandrae]|nr:hypothetical protein [Bradyrhizobium campsiandrae]
MITSELIFTGDVIRSFLSFTLQIEIEGRWPWRRHDMEAGDAERSSL